MIRSVLPFYSAILQTIVVCPIQLILHRSVANILPEGRESWAIMAVFCQKLLSN